MSRAPHTVVVADDHPIVHSGMRLVLSGSRFFELVGEYISSSGHAAAFPNFAARVEDILREEVEVYVTQVVRERGGSRSWRSKSKAPAT